MIEGIHALNPQYSKALSRDKVFKIFLSPITQLRVDETSVVKCVDAMHGSCNAFTYCHSAIALTLTSNACAGRQTAGFCAECAVISSSEATPEARHCECGTLCGVERTSGEGVAVVVVAGVGGGRGRGGGEQKAKSSCCSSDSTS